MNVPNKLIVVAVSLLVCLILFFAMFKIKPIHGNEVGVMETWLGGVSPDPLPPKTYFVLPWQRVQEYPTSVQVFIMNDKPEDSSEAGAVGKGRKQDAYLVQSKDSQDMHLSLQVQWRIDPVRVIDLHKQVGPKFIEEKVLRPTMLLVVKNEATMREAIEAYSGKGLVDLQRAIEQDLTNPKGELRQRGIIVDTFVIEHIKLDEKYVQEITARQIAMQKELRSKQEEKAANAEALNAKAKAQADYNKQVVEAERDKQKQILAAEAQKEQEIRRAEGEKQKVVLAAEALKEQVVLAGQARKEAGELEAAGILAVGRATAEAERLKFSAYSADGADTYAKIQIARSMGEAYSGIKGYLPEHMQIFTLGDNFLNAVDRVVGGGKEHPPARPAQK